MPVANFTGRGDLLRWMQHCHTQEEKRLSAIILGYELREPQAEIPPVDDDETKDQGLKHPVPKSQPISTAKISRPPELFYALAHRGQYADPNDSDDNLPPGLQGIEPLSDQDLQPFAAGEPIPHHALLTGSRLQGFSRSALSHIKGNKLDIPRLVKQIAYLQTLYHLPRKSRLVPAGRVYILLDLNKRLLPFWLDAHLVCESITRSHGRNGLEIRVIEDNPYGDYWDWFDDTQKLLPFRRFNPQSVVLIISDLGQLSVEDSGVRLHWLGFLKQLQRQAICPVVLAPISASRQEPELQSRVRQVLWSKYARLQPVRLDSETGKHSDAVRRVLALLSIATHVEPELLRAILGCLPAQQADSGVEAAVFLHADVQWGYTAISLRPEKRAEYQALFKLESAILQRQVLALIKPHHIGQFPAVWAEEVLNAKPLVNFPLEELADVKQAEQFMCRLARSMAGSDADQGLKQFSRRHLQRLGTDAKTQYQHSYTSALYGLAYAEQLRAGAELPAEYDAATVQATIRRRTELKRYALLQRGEMLYLRLNADSLPLTGVILADFETVHDTLLLHSTLNNDKQVLSRTPLNLTQQNSTEIPLAHLQEQTLILDTGLAQLTVAPFKKPAWADSIACHADGLKASLNFAGQTYQFRLQNSYGLQGGQKEPYKPKIAWQESFHYANWVPINSVKEAVGFDSYGLYADLTVKNITQRFRWIEPGSFMMGSQSKDKSRGEDEIQHMVTLTKGFWLADTAVTQALWLAVMGDNPSYFKDLMENPVEQVSWDDSQAFIERLNKLFRGLVAQLPTEAQWEYACRAGTETTFSFGDNITPQQVNHWGSVPYAGSEKGLYREKTVSVKSLPPNPWGLYEMHGNIYEWCRDVWHKNFTQESAIDPFYDTDHLTSAARVVRGGSWFDYGGDQRSAGRSRYEPITRSSFVGFRLALGHSELRQELAAGSGIQEPSRPAAGPDSGVAEQPQSGLAAGLREVWERFKGKKK